MTPQATRNVNQRMRQMSEELSVAAVYGQLTDDERQAMEVLESAITDCWAIINPED